MTRHRRHVPMRCLAFAVAAAAAACAAPDFAPVRPPDDWQTSSGEHGVTFSHPANLATRYIHTVDWPPDATLHPGPFTCTEAGSPTARAGRTELVQVADRRYCVTRVVEGAAGSVYTLYAWAVPAQDRVVILTFSLRAVQCGNYSEPERGECEQERRDFSVTPLMDRVARTIRIEASARPGR